MTSVQRGRIPQELPYKNSDGDDDDNGCWFFGWAAPGQVGASGERRGEGRRGQIKFSPH